MQTRRSTLKIIATTGILANVPGALNPRQSSGRMLEYWEFGEASLRQDARAHGYNPMENGLNDEQLSKFLGNVRKVIVRAVGALPEHEAYWLSN